MRPVSRGDSPRADDYENHRDAFSELVARIGRFCSYCERPILTLLAVEHIQPQNLPAYEHLKGRWDNFLLACVNCNSTKGHKDIVLDAVLLPDRDNTAAAYQYRSNGKIEVRARLTEAQVTMAERTLALTGLDRRPSTTVDPNKRLVAIDRVAQRTEVWSIAEESKSDLLLNPTDAFRGQIARTAVASGFFSVWMTVFEDDPVIRRLLIQEFAGTARECYDPDTTITVSPRPPNELPDGSKI